MLTSADSRWHSLTPAANPYHQLASSGTLTSCRTFANIVWHFQSFSPPLASSWHHLPLAGLSWLQLEPPDTGWHWLILPDIAMGSGKQSVTLADITWYQLTLPDNAWHSPFFCDIAQHWLTLGDFGWLCQTLRTFSLLWLVLPEFAWHWLTFTSLYLTLPHFEWLLHMAAANSHWHPLTPGPGTVVGVAPFPKSLS